MRLIDAEKIPYSFDVVPNADPRKSYFKATADKRDIDKLPTISHDEVRGVVKVNYEHGDYSCSACGHPARRLSFARKKYCDECGAKLLWEVSEDA